MASETEKTHALLQTCSTESLISSLGLGVFCLVADRLLQFSTIQQNDWLRALSDNAVHCVNWHVVMGSSHWNQEEDWLRRNHFSWIFSLCYWCRPLFSSWIHVFKGCFDSSAKTFPSLFYCDTCCGSDPEIYYAPFQAQRLMVLSSLDVIYILDFTPYPRWDSSWFVDMPIWKNFSFAILALCNNDIIFTSHLFIRYVFNRNQTNDVFKTWSSYWRLR